MKSQNLGFSSEREHNGASWMEGAWRARVLKQRTHISNTSFIQSYHKSESSRLSSKNTSRYRSIQNDRGFLIIYTKYNQKLKCLEEIFLQPFDLHNIELHRLNYKDSKQMMNAKWDLVPTQKAVQQGLGGSYIFSLLMSNQIQPQKAFLMFEDQLQMNLQITRASVHSHCVANHLAQCKHLTPTQRRT